MPESDIAHRSNETWRSVLAHINLRRESKAQDTEPRAIHHRARIGQAPRVRPPVPADRATRKTTQTQGSAKSAGTNCEHWEDHGPSELERDQDGRALAARSVHPLLHHRCLGCCRGTVPDAGPEADGRHSSPGHRSAERHRLGASDSGTTVQQHHGFSRRTARGLRGAHHEDRRRRTGGVREPAERCHHQGCCGRRRRAARVGRISGARAGRYSSDAGRDRHVERRRDGRRRCAGGAWTGVDRRTDPLHHRAGRRDRVRLLPARYREQREDPGEPACRFRVRSAEGRVRYDDSRRVVAQGSGGRRKHSGRRSVPARPDAGAGRLPTARPTAPRWRSRSGFPRRSTSWRSSSRSSATRSSRRRRLRGSRT